MDGEEGIQFVSDAMGDMQGDVWECERLFEVGELVVFWAGTAVRGYRTDSGDPVYVKEIQGSGWYGIKMVGSFRGRNRRVFWKNLFKDSSFAKKVVSAGGARVRTKARMQERATDEAQAKLGQELRETRRILQIKDKETKDIQKQGEERVKGQEAWAKRAEKVLKEGHKRELADVREDLKRNREEDKQLHLELVRDVRLKTRTIQRELEETQEDLLEKVKANDVLVTAVSKGTGQLRSLREGGLRWKTKFLASQDDVKGKTRQIRKDLAKTQQDLLQTKGTNVVLVEEVSKGAAKLSRCQDDGLMWKSKYLVGQEEVRLRGVKLDEAKETIRDLGKECKSANKRYADMHADLRAQLDAACTQAKVSLYPVFFFSSCHS
jgi:hypothetical protein